MCTVTPGDVQALVAILDDKHYHCMIKLLTYVSSNLTCFDLTCFFLQYYKSEAKLYCKCTCGFFYLVGGWGGEGPSKCCGEVMHGKCSWNTTRSQSRQEQGGWWCRKRGQKGIAPGHFLKAPYNLSHFVILSATHSTAWSFSIKEKKVNLYSLCLASIKILEYVLKCLHEGVRTSQCFNTNIMTKHFWICYWLKKIEKPYTWLFYLTSYGKLLEVHNCWWFLIMTQPDDTSHAIIQKYYFLPLKHISKSSKKNYSKWLDISLNIQVATQQQQPSPAFP